MLTHLLFEPIKGVPEGSVIFPVTFAAATVSPNRPSVPATTATLLKSTETFAPEFVTTTS